MRLGWFLVFDGQEVTFANALALTGDPRLAAQVMSCATGATED